ncbi:MAG: hypothetical protein A2504_07635 [Bdellovibrionales bacterium RIFOXYD12_FULL_39_22]|nr:MAG: hypothetical protein A2385_10960 [Bdellovibrionales bacterium RIFOXYB1_FULL_39_21]OFZ70734.1 MAG: hypothetical protein A2451_05075 [Bdellovibrionales bacterium RIFOXYC2_FULL_39_8]OFZ74436.1 MAG: hypothetical protein A2560_11290 [Bdellovibrionales bacterium RIFOXYD1_FULL_39_84]OFZ92448.1 MAG: hypothetical protein A2504_07635 [Bdellovibrionales bacterium RIFOXYD12_FULL_39_22]HLE12491.1 IS1634 family transposase [Bacteriovoracaceae bacterium]
MVPTSELQEVSRQNWGAIFITKKLIELLKIDSCFEKLLRDRKIKADILSIITFLIAERLATPRSKYASYNHQSWYVQNPVIDLHNIYRTLDFLAVNIDPIKQHLFEKQKEIFKLDVSVVFYDVTTFYFESKNEDDLKKFGYSKDCKFGDVQVVAGALIDKTGRPLDYEIFSSNTYEGNTLKNFVARAKNKFNISDVIIVSDRGLNSGQNLVDILNTGLDYIVSHRLKNAPQEVQEQVFIEDGYVNASTNKEEILKYKIIQIEKNVRNADGSVYHINDKIVVTYQLNAGVKIKC